MNICAAYIPMRLIKEPPIAAWLRRYAPHVHIFYVPDDGENPTKDSGFTTLDWRDIPRHSLATGTLRTPTANWNLGWKRTAAMVHARSQKFERVLLIDNDINLINATPLFSVADALSQYPIVSAISINSPDRSAFGHALSLINIDRAVMPSASFLGIHVPSVLPYFPNNYNEDWFFFLVNYKFPPLTVSAVFQSGFELFGPNDAEDQEHYDFLAEGAWHAATTGDLGSLFDEGFWLDQKSTRLNILSRLENELRLTAPTIMNDIARMSDQLGLLEPKDCGQYMRRLFSCSSQFF